LIALKLVFEILILRVAFIPTSARGDDLRDAMMIWAKIPGPWLGKMRRMEMKNGEWLM